MTFSFSSFCMKDEKTFFIFLNGQYTVLLKSLSIKYHRKKYVLLFPQKYETAQLFSTLIIIRNVSSAENHYIRMKITENLTFPA